MAKPQTMEAKDIEEKQEEIVDIIQESQSQIIEDAIEYAAKCNECGKIVSKNTVKNEMLRDRITYYMMNNEWDIIQNEAFKIWLLNIYGKGVIIFVSPATKSRESET